MVIIYLTVMIGMRGHLKIAKHCRMKEKSNEKNELYARRHLLVKELPCWIYSISKSRILELQYFSSN